MNASEIKFEASADHHLSETSCFMNSGEQRDETEPDIIILDDDDFIQTTLNLFNQTSHHHHHHHHQAELTTSANILSNNDEHELIDLTCGDFDLNDIFLIDASSQPPLSSQNQATRAADELGHAQVKLIKNEFADDLKMFDFNIMTFNSCMDEILIDDDDEENNNRELEANEAISIDNQSESNSSSLHMPNESNSSESSLPDSAYQLNLLRCDKCLKTFNKLFNLKRHQFMHAAKEADSQQHQQQQTQIESESNNFNVNQCVKCGRKILDKSNFKKHVKICFKNESAPAADSSLDFTFNHATADRAPSNGVNTTKSKSHRHKSTSALVRFQCEVCQKLFNKKFNFHRHLRIHFLNEIMNNQHEDGGSAQEESMIVTATTESASPSPQNVNLEFFQCGSCPRRFIEQKQLKTHALKWHLTEHACTHCELKFAEKLDFIRHLNLVHAVRLRFECAACRRSFAFMSQYVQHRRGHLTGKSAVTDLGQEQDGSVTVPSRCDLCRKVFSKDGNLKRHMTSVHKISGDSSEPVSSNHRLKYDTNSVQKSFYEGSKLNFHLSKIDFNK
jgi:hypothetical protein